MVGGVRRGSSDAMIIAFFIMESVLGNVTVKQLGFLVYVLVVLVIVKQLGVVSDIFFIHFEVFLVLDVLLLRKHTDGAR